MELKNKLGLEGLAFQQEEERISKQKARRLFELLDDYTVEYEQDAMKDAA